MRFFALLITLFLVSNSLFADIPPCPAADKDFVAGCVYLNEDSSDVSSRNIRLFYQWYKGFDSNKETIILLNGGPGGSLNGYTQVKMVLDLQKDYNILFYDQRGIGRSSTVTDVENVDLRFYHTSHNIDDIEMIREKVIKQDKVILLGHSYGAHLAYGYGVKFPNRISKVIALNGSADYQAVMTQAYYKEIALDKALEVLDQATLDTFITLLQEGKINNSLGQPIAFNSFLMYAIGLISSYDGQESGVKNLFDRLISVNSLAIKEHLEKNGPIRSSDILSRYTSTPSQVLNPILNPFVVCNDLLPEYGLNEIPAEMREIAAYAKQSICPTTTNENDLTNVFDVKDKLLNIQVPTLIVGGTHDPLVHISYQQRDYKILKESNPLTAFITMNKVGHQIYENEKCLSSKINQFLSDKLNFESSVCYRK